MGSGHWDPSSWTTFSSTAKAAAAPSAVYTARTLHENLDPKNADGTPKLRESRDSPDNPNSTPIIVALDVTGSMGHIAHEIAKEGLGVLFTEVLDRKPVTDPHVMFMAVGDAFCDRAPLQVSQFEADKRIIEQLTQIYLEGGGGGNLFESYDLPWYFAGLHTVHDAMEKRGRKGYLFTVGDEPAPDRLTVSQLRQFIGDDVPSDISAAESLRMAQKLYHVFHVVVKRGTGYGGTAQKTWDALLGEQHVLPLDDHTKLSEVIVSAIQVVEGSMPADVIKSWSGSTAVTVSNAIARMGGAVVPAAGTGVRRF